MKSVMIRCLTLLLMLSCLYLPSSMAQTTPPANSDLITVHRTDLTPEQIKLAESKQALEQAKTEVGKYAEVIGLGKAVGIGMREGLEALTDTADKFSKTQVGHFTMFLIAYKIIGTDLIQLLIGLPMFIVVTWCVIWSYRRNCIPYKIKIEDGGMGKAKKWELVQPEHVGNSNYMWAHFGAWALATGACSAICFL